VSVLAFVKGKSDPVSEHFLAKEFDCPCGVCGMTFVDEDLIAKLEALRMRLGVPIRITSGYRCDYHQRELAARGLETASGRSQHQDGKAADLSTGKHSGMDLERHARAVGFQAVGVGRTWVHVDLRGGRDRHWGYKT
jgi:zinc D-Ala-D-Ala carboxypeptidase